MPSIPRVLALIGLFAGIALAQPRTQLVPVIPVEPAVWTQLDSWQQDHFNKLYVQTGWQQARSVPPVQWKAMNEAQKAELMLHEVKDESGRRLRKEALRWFTEELNWQRDPALGTRQEKEEFIDAVSGWKLRYPLATTDANLRSTVAQLNDRSFYYQQQLSYTDAHPQQTAATAIIKQSRADIHPGMSQAELNAMYEKGKGGVTAPPPVHGRGPGGEPSQIAATTSKPPTKIDGAVPPPLKWKYVVTPPLVMTPEQEKWRKDNEADRHEKEFVEYIMKTLDAPVERDLLAEVAVEQAKMDQEKKAKIARIQGNIKQIDDYVANPGANPKDVARLKEDRKTLVKRLANARAFDTELTITMADLPSTRGANVYLDGGPGADGKQRVRMEINRDFARANQPGENAKDGTRKVMTHEMRHVADFYAISRNAGPPQAYLEPRGYLAGSVSYKQEGFPKGRLPEIYAADNYRWMSGDPGAWMFRQMNEYISEAGVLGPGKLWMNLTPDDYADPNRALDWRLQHAYRYTVHAADKSDQPREAVFERLGKDFQLSAIQRAHLAVLDADKSIPDKKKAAIFSQKAAFDPMAAAFIKKLKTTPKADVLRAQREEADFFNQLRPLF